MNEQLDLFAQSYEKPNFPKHIRLIEFFAGIGAQAKALEILGADFEHWRTCEWSWQSIFAYNAIHMGGRVIDFPNLTYEEVLERIKGVSHDYNQPMSEKQLRGRGEKWARELLGRMAANKNLCPNVSNLHAKDLGIEDRENNTYILTYSFPCQDLSLAGTQKGYEKGSSTRSGLLWEVERILNECKEINSLPQILVMENVPMVCGSTNLKPWNDWLQALHKLGYTSYFKILNGKDYQIPQDRKRCFMVSLLGNYSYTFPRPTELRYCLADFIKNGVDGKYYLSDRLMNCFVRHTERHKARGNGFEFKPSSGNGVAHTITSREGQRTCDTFLYDGKSRSRIRKLTEGECMRLMGFEEKDTEACRKVGLSRANIYHQSGDSIISTVLVGIFGEVLGIDYQKRIDDYSSKLHQETIAHLQ